MKHHIFSSDKTFPSFSDYTNSSTVSKAISDADKLSVKKGCDMVVVRMLDGEIRVLDYYGLKVLKSEVEEKLYSAHHGFVFN